MSKHRLLAAFLCVVLAGACGCGKDSSSKPSSSSGPAGSPSPSVAKYPGTADGLKKMMEDALSAARNDDARLTGIVQAMALPQPEAWFTKVFEGGAAARLAKEYQEMLAKDFLKQGRELLLDLCKKERTQVTITAIQDANDTHANGSQVEAFKAMKAPVPLYTARFIKAGESAGTALWSFVWAEDGWRLVGKMRTAKPVP
jgi:hypothetical protein